MPSRKLAVSRVVMEEFVEPALSYYEEILQRITPYFFAPNLIRLVGFQQLIISSIYQIKREDARSSKGVDYVRECVSRISAPHDLIDIMRSWLSFDLNLTCPAFRNPLIATYIRKNYCLITTKYFDCHNCPRTSCRENLLWDHSFIGLDIDAGDRLEQVYNSYLDFLEDKSWSGSFKLSSLNGLHLQVGLPTNSGSTPFDRNVFHWIVVRELQEAGLPVDDNSLDVIPILRAPFALHYRRLTPSLPFDEGSFHDTIETLKQLEGMNERDRIREAARTVKGWRREWTTKQVSPSLFEREVARWRVKAETTIFRELGPKRIESTAASSILRKGREMSEYDAKQALSLLTGEGRSEALAMRIIYDAKKREPKRQHPKVEKEVTLQDQSDIPEVALNIPPPLLFLLIDNATIKEMRELVGTDPVPVKSLCKTTGEGMQTLFQRPRFFKRYGRKWNTKTAYIGGLHSAYLYCAAADQVLSVKETSPWDRDSRVVDELERKLGQKGLGAIVVHLLGLDYCKDRGLPIDGAMLVFKRLTRSVLGTDRNVVVTSDHSGEPAVPFFALLTSKASVLA